MIDLTQEQWQAITKQENPTVIHPGSKTAYVVIRKDEYEKLRTATDTEADAAYVLRIAWITITPPAKTLRKYAIKY